MKAAGTVYVEGLHNGVPLSMLHSQLTSLSVRILGPCADRRISPLEIVVVTGGGEQEGGGEMAVMIPAGDRGINTHRQLFILVY